MILTLMKKTLKILNIKWIPVIIITFLIGLGILSYNFLVNYNKLTMVMSLNYPQAEKGLYPDGKKFNVFRIKSDDVLDGALARYSETGLTVDKLRGRIDVYEKTSNKYSEKVKSANVSGEDFKYIPNEYIISYSQKNKFTKNHTYEMLTAIAESYEDNFKNNHAENNKVLQLDVKSFIEYDNYEYVEIADLLLSKTNAIEKYILKRKDESSSYISDETGESYANLYTMINNFKEIEIEKFKAFIISSAISKNRGAFINKLYYTNNNLEFEKRKAIIEADFTKDTMQKYDPNITGVAFIPTLDKDNEFYMHRTKTGIDYLALTAYSAGITAEKIIKEKEYNTYLIYAFLNNGHEGGDEDGLRFTAEQMLSELKDKLSVILSVAQKADSEYILYKTRDYIKFNIPENSFFGSFHVVAVAMQMLWVFLLVSLLYIFKNHFVRGV